MLECFKYLGCKQGDFPEAEKAASQTLALPIYQGLTLEMQQYVVEKIAEFYKK
jgi:dTDP-4-amino-4,6-dideoxygalactose transaminase